MRFPPEIMPNYDVYTGNYTGNYYEEFTASIYNCRITIHMRQILEKKSIMYKSKI